MVFRSYLVVIIKRNVYLSSEGNAITMKMIFLFKLFLFICLITETLSINVSFHRRKLSQFFSSFEIFIFNIDSLFFLGAILALSILLGIKGQRLLPICIHTLYNLTCVDTHYKGMDRIAKALLNLPPTAGC